MDDVLASRFRKTRARRRFQNQKMRRTRREHAACCPRVMAWSGQVTQGYQGMLQESQTEEESRVTLIRLTGFIRNMTQIGGQIGLLRTAGVTGTAARVSRQIGLLGSVGVTETSTQVEKLQLG
jgi:hypothetical protein